MAHRMTLTAMSILWGLGVAAGCATDLTAAPEGSPPAAPGETGAPPASGASAGATSETAEATPGATPDAAHDTLGRIVDLLNDGCGWTQWGQSAAHDGGSCARGQEPRTVLDHIVYDPFQVQEIREGGGDLFVHYQVPLNDDDGNFYMMQKSGAYTSCDPAGSGQPAPCGIDPANIAKEIWSEKRYQRGRDGAFHDKWTFESDWKPFPVRLWEPMFQPALHGPLLYVPGAGGTVWQVLTVLDRPIALQRINPFPTVDPNTYVSGGVTVDKRGFVYWNVLQRNVPPVGNKGFLVKAAPWGQTWIVDYQALTPGAPAVLDQCYTSFVSAVPRPPLPWPPSADALPPQFPCGRQRPAANITPTIGPDGTIFTASTADFNTNYSYLIAVHPDLSLAWATSLRGLVNDGCGVHRDGFPEGDSPCSTTFSAVGVDPATNLPPAVTVDDRSSSNPVALPDGGVVYGGLDDYNFARGHLIKLDRHGQFAASFTFGWDSTPAVYEHDHTYSLVIKDNHYFTQGPFLLSQLSSNLEIEWSFQNTTTQACVRQPDGTLTCTDHTAGFEWCVNAPAVDRQGTVYANSEDGSVYQIKQGGVLETQTFLNQALGAAYTPISLDPAGRVYVLNNGELTVFGR